MITLQEVTTAMHKYRFLMLLWTAACVFAIASHFTLATFTLLGLGLFMLAAATTATAGVSCAYVIARDSI